MKAVFLSVLACASLAFAAPVKSAPAKSAPAKSAPPPAVVSIDRPQLVLPGASVAALANARFTATRVGSFFTPGPLASTRVTKVKSVYGGVDALHVEMQCEDAEHLKCLVLELTDSPKGVLGWVIASRNMLLKQARLGTPFEQPDGKFAGGGLRAVVSDQAPGYGLRNLAVEKQ